MTTAPHISAARGTPESVFDSARGSRRSRAIANTSRPAAACPASAAKAAPIAAPLNLPKEAIFDASGAALRWVP